MSRNCSLMQCPIGYDSPFPLNVTSGLNISRDVRREPVLGEHYARYQGSCKRDIRSAGSQRSYTKGLAILAKRCEDSEISERHKCEVENLKTEGHLGKRLFGT